MEEECPVLKEQPAEGAVADRAWEYEEQQDRVVESSEKGHAMGPQETRGW